MAKMKSLVLCNFWLVHAVAVPMISSVFRYGTDGVLQQFRFAENQTYAEGRIYTLKDGNTTMYAAGFTYSRNGISIFLDHLRQPDIKSYSNAIQVSTTIFNDGFYRSHGFISLGRTILMNDLTSLRVAGLIDFITQQGHRLAIGIFRIQRIDRTCVNINLTINLFKIERSTVAIYGLARLDVGNYDRGGIQLYAGVRHFRTW